MKRKRKYKTKKNGAVIRFPPTKRRCTDEEEVNTTVPSAQKNVVVHPLTDSILLTSRRAFL